MAMDSANSEKPKWRMVLAWGLVSAFGALGLLRGGVILAFGFGDGSGDPVWQVALPLLLVFWLFVVGKTLLRILGHPLGGSSKLL